MNVMKKLFYMLVALVLACGCYDDKGNYDYKTLDDLTITLPATSYSLLFGERLQISPTIETDIPGEDLKYEWEFYGKDGDNYWNLYLPVYEGKDLDFLCQYSDTLLKGEGTYQLRLNVTQHSTGRHFYSETVSVKLAFQLSHIGAMVLHGVDGFSDIGIVVSDEFQVVAPSTSVETEVYPHFYSDANAGQKIEGRGQWIVQTCAKSAYKIPESIEIIAVTDKSSAVAHSKSLLKNGEWNDLFYGGLNQGKPGGFFINSMTVFVIDGGDVFTKLYTDVAFSVPLYTASDYEYDFSPGILPFLHHGWNANFKAFAFDQNRRGFIVVTGVLNNFNKFSPVDALAGNEEGKVPFNPADMQADLVHMDLGGAGDHMLAVMRTDNGDYFIAEMDISVSSFPDVPKYKYDLMHLDDVRNNRVVDWAFGSSFMNMCYYATPDGVFRFSVDYGKTIQPEVLMTQNNTPVRFEGTITMMKILKPGIYSGENNDTYYKSNVEMVVGTYGGVAGSGILYALELDPLSGRVMTVQKYEGFDEIYDVNIKGY